MKAAKDDGQEKSTGKEIKKYRLIEAGEGTMHDAFGTAEWG